MTDRRPVRSAALSPRRRGAGRAALAMLVMLLAGAATGCGPKQANLYLDADDSDRQFTQRFPRAAYARAKDGTYDAVVWMPESSGAPVRHVVHVRVLWRPESGIDSSHPSATNASLDWYVLSPDGSRLHYEGAGFVAVFAGDERSRFSLRGIPIALRSRVGEMNDPIGRATVRGSFVADRNDDRVAELLEQLRAARPQTGTTGRTSPTPTRPADPSPASPR